MRFIRDGRSRCGGEDCEPNDTDESLPYEMDDEDAARNWRNLTAMLAKGYIGVAHMTDDPINGRQVQITYGPDRSMRAEQFKTLAKRKGGMATGVEHWKRILEALGYAPKEAT